MFLSMGIYGPGRESWDWSPSDPLYYEVILKCNDSDLCIKAISQICLTY